MQKGKRSKIAVREHLGSILLIVYGMSCIILFMLTTGKGSFIHQYTLDDWKSLPFALARIQWSNFIFGFIVSLAGMTIVFLACTALGCWVLRKLGIGKESGSINGLQQSAYLVSGFLTGQLISSFLFFFLAAAGRMIPLSVGLVLLFMLSFSLPVLRDIRNLFQKAQQLFFREERPFHFDKVLIWFGLALLVGGLLYSTSRLSYDAVSMYFSNAKLMAMTGRILYVRSGSFLVSSLHLGVQYAAIIQLFGDQSARMNSWVGGVSLIVLLLDMGRVFGISRRAEVILFTFCITSTAFFDLLGDGKIDLMASAYSLGAVYWLLQRKDRAVGRAVILAGVMAGFSIISRPYNAFLLIVFIGLLILWSARIRKEGFKFIEIVLLGTTGALMICMHLAASWMVTTNPLETLTTAIATGTKEWQWTISPENLWIVRILYPFFATFINTPQSLGNISPLFLAILPGLFLRAEKKNNKANDGQGAWYLIALITMASWLIVSFAVLEIRYVLFLWGILFIPLSVRMDELISSGSIYLRVGLKSSILVLIIFMIGRTLVMSIGTYSPIDNNGAAHCFDSPICEYLRPLNDIAPAQSRVLTLSSNRYYFRPDLFLCATMAGDYAELKPLFSRSPEAFWEQVYQMGYEYVAYEENYSTRHLNFDFIKIANEAPDWVDLRKISSSRDGAQATYRITYIGRPPVTKPACVSRFN